MKKLTLFVILLSVLASCKKDKTTTCNQDMAGISGTYKVTAITYKASAGAAEQDYYTTVFANACQRDDVYILNANSTYTFTDAGVKCAPEGDRSGTWTLSGNEVFLDGFPNTIHSFNCSTFVYSEVGRFAPGDEVKYTLSRQ